MSDTGAPAQQKSELAHAGVGGTGGAVSALLHRDEVDKQSKDVQEQQLAEQVSTRAAENRKAYTNDPIRKPGLSNAASSRHAQMGSHGLSGQAPK